MLKQSPERAYKELLTKYPDAEMLWQSHQDGRFVICCRAYTRQGVTKLARGKSFISSAKQEDPITLLTTITGTSVNHYELKAVSLKDSAAAV